MADFYFGNLMTGAMKRPAPETGMEAQAVGTSETMVFSNGGAFISQSEGTHREFNMSWAVNEKSVMNFLNEYRSGAFGDGLLYMIDPFASNVLPPHWANPALTTRGWPSLVSPSVKPVAVETVPLNPTAPFASIANSMPRYSAQYTLTGTPGNVPVRVLTLLIPDNQDLHIGFSGSATNGAALRVRPITRAGAYAADSALTLLSPTASTRMNAKFAGATYRAVQVYMTTTLPGAATLTLTSGKAVYSPVGVTPSLTGAHVEGEGHTGLRFEGDPTMVYIQSAKGRKLVSTAAKFTEVGAWL